MISQDKKVELRSAQANDSVDQLFQEPKDNPPPITGKGPQAFRTISEVSEELHVPQHVLRFWETRFKMIAPLKRNGGRRYYRSEDVALLKRVADLLYIQGYTIKGVQRMLEENVLLQSDTAESTDSSSNSLKTIVANDTVTNENQIISDHNSQQIETEFLQKRNNDLTQILEIVLQELQILRKVIAETN